MRIRHNSNRAGKRVTAMCELFCLSSLLPAVATISLRRFAEHRGPGGRSIDGWGLALFDGGDLRLYREPCPARDDPWLEFIQTRRIPSRLLISHIRHATQGAVTLANTQPFVREIAGRMHCFAHNGHLPCIENLHSPAPAHYRPVGDTDSEYAACLLFESMAALWRGRQVPILQGPASRPSPVLRRACASSARRTSCIPMGARSSPMATGACRRTAASPRPACGGCNEAALLILTPSLGPACISRRPLGRRGLPWWQACR